MPLIDAITIFTIIVIVSGLGLYLLYGWMMIANSQQTANYFLDEHLWSFIMANVAAVAISITCLLYFVHP